VGRGGVGGGRWVEGEVGWVVEWDCCNFLSN
jgi:hypothetical protein